jgi:hypothetical protein
MAHKGDMDERFIAAVDSLRARGIVRSDRDMSKQLGFSENYVRFVRNGNQSVQAEALRQLSLKYSVSPYWLFSDVGTMYEDRAPLLPPGAAPGDYNVELARMRAAEPGIVVHEPTLEDRVARLERQLAAMTKGLAEV